MPVAVGLKGLDSGKSIDPTAARRSGSGFQFRYSAGAGNFNGQTDWKLCEVGEIASIEATGQMFLANSEWYETRCTEGAAAGARDGAADLAFWKSRGLPHGESIYISWDAAPSAGEYAGVKAYVEAYNAALGGYYVADGLYAGIPALVWMSQHSITRHGWIPEGASWSCAKAAIDPDYAPPARTNWQLWFPTPSQINPGIAYLNKLMSGHRLVSCIWQDGNKWFDDAADENVVNIAGPLSTVQGGGTTHPASLVPPAPSQKLWQGHPVPALIAQGSGQYLGSISGPAASHGGSNADERAIVRILQQRLIACDFVPGVTDPNSGWADGIYDAPGDAPNSGATSQAVARFQHAHMPGTTFYGQCWWDDWTTLFNL